MALTKGNRYRKADGSVYDDRYEGPGALARPATGASTDIVKPLTTETAENYPQTTTAAGSNGVGLTSPGQVSASASYSRTSGFNAPEVSPFAPSARTQDYYNRLSDMEGNKPGPFQSRYEGAIQSILDGILNKKSFDASKDANYQLLYDQARQSYMQAGDKAMRDTMGAMQAQTGGYGSTAATIAGSQAYDNYLQGMNDNNSALMQLAYQMYQDDRNDQYNQLGAVTGLDDTDYARYRDDVGDYYNDLNYLADMYAGEYARDFGSYTDARDYAYQVAAAQLAQENWQTQFDYQKEQDALANQMALQRLAAGSGSGRSCCKSRRNITDRTTIRKEINHHGS